MATPHCFHCPLQQLYRRVYNLLLRYGCGSGRNRTIWNNAGLLYCSYRFGIRYYWLFGLDSSPIDMRLCRCLRFGRLRL